MSRVDTALHLAEKGYQVFPSRVAFGPDGTKKTQPLVKWITANAATTLPGMIREWWKQWPDAYPCIDCGKSNIVVVDCDVKHCKSGCTATHEHCEPDCPSGLERWTDETSDRVTTASGGAHHYYRANPEHPAGVDADGKIDRHVDVRGVGGMVIVHDNADLSALPKTEDLKPVADTVYTRVPAGLTKPKHTEPLESRFDLPTRPFTREAAIDFCRPAMQALKSAAAGININTRLNDAACQFSHFVPHFFSEHDVTTWLIDAQRQAWTNSGHEDDGDYSAALATIRSGLGQRRDKWRATPIASQSSDVEVKDFPEKQEPQLSELDLAIVRERIRREARRVVDDEESSLTASDEAVKALGQELLTFDELDSIEDLEPLVEGWLYKDSVARIIGPSGSYKTFVAMDLALSVANKSAWWGYNVTPGPVVYVVAEGARGFRNRARAWMIGRNDLNKVENFYTLPRPVQMLDDEWITLTQTCKGIGAALIVIDTQARVTVGVDENSATDMGRVVDRAEHMRRETGACVLIIHHTGYEGKHGRGSTAVYGALQSELSIEKDGHNVTIKASKQKDSEELEARFTMRDVHISDTNQSLVLGQYVNETEMIEEKRTNEVLTYIAQAKLDADTHARHIALILFELTIDGMGATRAEVRAILNEELNKNGRKPIAKGSESDSWRILAKNKYIERGETPSRWRLSTLGQEYIGAPSNSEGL